MILVYKVATTGLVNFKEADDHPSQPHIVAVTALLCTPTGRVEQRLHDLVRPDGWEIPAASTQFHGVSTKAAASVGRPEPEILGAILDIDAKASRRVAHNESFDSKAVRQAMARYPAVADGRVWPKDKGICSMRAALDHLAEREPTTFHGRYAKLDALHQAVLGEPHDGGVDTASWAESVRRIWFEIQRRASRGEAA